MAEQNVFDLLNDEDTALETNSPPASTNVKDENQAELSINIAGNIVQPVEASNQEAWTDVSSTKTRKLAPQFTLSKENFGHERGRQSQPVPEAAKKKGALSTIRSVHLLIPHICHACSYKVYPGRSPPSAPCHKATSQRAGGEPRHHF